jgi:hypothetical protein
VKISVSVTKVMANISLVDSRVSQIRRDSGHPVSFFLAHCGQFCCLGDSEILKAGVSSVAALSVQSTRTLHLVSVLCGPCCLPALTWSNLPSMIFSFIGLRSGHQTGYSSG